MDMESSSTPVLISLPYGSIDNSNHEPPYSILLNSTSAVPSIQLNNTDVMIMDAETANMDTTFTSKTFSVTLSWCLLALAIFFEITGTTCMKLSNGLTKPLPSVMIFLSYACAFTCFPLSLKQLQLSTAYAIWSGVGTTVTAMIGILYFHDTVNWLKILALLVIICGCVVLQFADEFMKQK